MRKALRSALTLALISIFALPAGGAEHGNKGFEFESDDGLFLLQIQTRFQFRISHPSDDDPVSLDPVPDQTSLDIRRGRLKVGGHAWQTWLKYYWEYDFPSSQLLDFRVTLQRYEEIGLRVGQWKSRYTRERVISSGKQQMMDRSILNRPFTIDRQQGISLLGRLGRGKIHDLNDWASVLTGTGRGARSNDDVNLMYLLRLQWNPLGRKVSFEGSDLARSQPALGIVLAGVTNTSPYTRFSGAGGGQLDGFEDGVAGQYRVHQAMFETIFRAAGLAWQQELHYKEIQDRVADSTTILVGNYAQLGYFLNGVIDAIPPELELAFRHAVYDPDRNRASDLQQEFSIVANWFFNGHRNKLTAATTYLEYHVDEETFLRREWRFHLQWDVSL